MTVLVFISINNAKKAKITSASSKMSAKHEMSHIHLCILKSNPRQNLNLIIDITF